MTLQINNAPLRERHSYLDPNIQITLSVGVVSVFTKPVNRYFSHSVFLIEGLGSDGRLFHSLYTLDGYLAGNSMSSIMVSKVSHTAAGILYALRNYGIAKLYSVEFENFDAFSNTVPLINAFSLWETSQDNVRTLMQSLQERSESPPPYSLSGTGNKDGQRAYNCFTFAQEELKKIGIEATNTHSYRNYLPLLSVSGDTHIGKIESATRNCLGVPPHLRDAFERRG